jgi:hypothetical protein
VFGYKNPYGSERKTGMPYHRFFHTFNKKYNLFFRPVFFFFRNVNSLIGATPVQVKQRASRSRYFYRTVGKKRYPYRVLLFDTEINGVEIQVFLIARNADRSFEAKPDLFEELLGGVIILAGDRHDTRDPECRPGVI